MPPWRAGGQAGQVDRWTGELPTSRQPSAISSRPPVHPSTGRHRRHRRRLDRARRAPSRLSHLRRPGHRVDRAARIARPAGRGAQERRHLPRRRFDRAAGFAGARSSDTATAASRSTTSASCRTCSPSCAAPLSSFPTRTTSITTCSRSRARPRPNGKGFDLGRYPKGSSKSWTFDTPGTVQVFCHIHSGHERRRARAVQSVLRRRPTDDRRYVIDDVPEGDYTIVGWHERAKAVVKRDPRRRRTDDDRSTSTFRSRRRSRNGPHMADASLLIRLRRSALSVKLAALGAAVTAVVVLLAFLALSVEIRGNTERSLSDELLRNQKTLQQIEAHDASQLVFAAGLITQTPSFQYDLSIYRVEKNTAGRRAPISSTRWRTSCARACADVGGNLLARDRRLGPRLRRRGRQRRHRAARDEPHVARRRAARARPAGAGRRRAGSACCAPTSATSRSPRTRSCRTASRSARSCWASGSTRRSSRRRARRPTRACILTAGRRRRRVERFGRSTRPRPAPLLAARGTDTAPATVRVGGDDYVVAPVLLGETQDARAGASLDAASAHAARHAAHAAAAARRSSSTARSRCSSPPSARRSRRARCSGPVTRFVGVHALRRRGRGTTGALRRVDTRRSRCARSTSRSTSSWIRSPRGAASSRSERPS